MNPIFRSTVCVLAVGMVVGACRTTPHDSSATQAAISSADEIVSRASADPNVAKYAPDDLGHAQNSLNQAHTTFKDTRDTMSYASGDAKATNYAYLAHQQAATAIERGREGAAKDAFKVASAERDSLLASASTANTQTASANPDQNAVQFAFNDAKLPAGSAGVIQHFADVLKNSPDRKVAVQGHTDGKGTQKYNMNLAQRRAESVRKALVAQGVDRSRIETQAYGEEYPVASNTTDNGRQENRRADIVLSDAQGRVAQGPVTGSPTSTGSSEAGKADTSSGK